MIYRKIFYFSDDALSVISKDEEFKGLWMEYINRQVNYADAYLIMDSTYKPRPLLNFIPGLTENKTFYTIHNESPF